MLENRSDYVRELMELYQAAKDVGQIAMAFEILKEVKEAKGLV